MKRLPKNLIIIIIGVLAGVVGGFLYWRLVGCSSGSCAITSHWYTSIIFGGLAGYLLSDGLADMLGKKKSA